MLKIDFGSGYNPKMGYKTCDITFGPGLDYAYDKVRNEIVGLHYGSVDEFYCKNVLHHADIVKVVECFSKYLKQKGKLVIIEPQESYYEKNRCLDILWYRYIYPRYEISIPPTKRVDYLPICLRYFKLVGHYRQDIYDAYVFVKD